MLCVGVVDGVHVLVFDTRLGVAYDYVCISVSGVIPVSARMCVCGVYVHVPACVVYGFVVVSMPVYGCVSRGVHSVCAHI